MCIIGSRNLKIYLQEILMRSPEANKSINKIQFLLKNIKIIKTAKIDFKLTISPKKLKTFNNSWNQNSIKANLKVKNKTKICKAKTIYKKVKFRIFYLSATIRCNLLPLDYIMQIFKHILTDFYECQEQQ